MIFGGGRDLKYPYMYNRRVEGQLMQELVVISYNVHSVLSQARFDALLEEIADILGYYSFGGDLARRS